ncbi:Cytochrome b561 [Echinococcus granulosus]|nr:Cytochrome b561 [Echinococcus granulosus]
MVPNKLSFTLKQDSHPFLLIAYTTVSALTPHANFIGEVIVPPTPAHVWHKHSQSAEMNLRTYDSLDRPPNEEASKKRCLIPIAAIAQIFGIAAVVMCTVWMGYYYGGFDWRNPALVFNYHPVFMVIGMIFCFGDAMLIYRVFHKCPKLPLKAVHGVLMILGLLFSVVGFKAAFDSHNMRGIPDVYSIHSWIGLVTVVLFAVQWVVGLIAFLVPYIPPRVRSKILPLHTATGLFLLCCALVAAISGITEKNFGSTYKDLPAPAMLSNFMGVCLVVFCGMVFYLVHRHDYRRIEPTNGEQVGFRSLN